MTFAESNRYEWRVSLELNWRLYEGRKTVEEVKEQTISEDIESHIRIGKIGNYTIPTEDIMRMKDEMKSYYGTISPDSSWLPDESHHSYQMFKLIDSRRS